MDVIIIQCLIIIMCIFLWLSINTYAFNSPPKCFNIVWIAQIILGCIFLYTILYIDFASIFYIIGGIFLFNLGWYLFDKTFKSRPLGQIRTSTKGIGICLGILIVLGFLNPILSIFRYGGDIQSLLSMELLLELNNSMSIERYSEVSEKPSMLMQLLSVFTYCGPLYAGYVYSVIKNRFVSLLAWLTLLPGIFVALTQAVKMAMITSFMLWISGFITYSIITNRRININFKKFFYFSIGLCCFISILFFSMILRTGKIDDNTILIIKDKFANYAVGQLSSFGIWFNGYNEFDEEHTFGAKSFYGISNQLGILKREQGLFSEAVRTTKMGTYGNIYTLFRILIEDFGLIGCYFVLFSAGSISRYIYVRLQQHKNIVVNSTLMCLILFMIFWSFVTTALAYTSYLLMFMLFGIIVRLTIKFN